MTDLDPSVDWPLDQTALIVPVPDADPLVDVWRDEFDPNAAYGVPAHLTVVYPFLPADRITPDDLEALSGIAAGFRSVAVTLARSDRFEPRGDVPGVLYLVPEPEQPFRELTEQVAARWPEAPPYNGAFDDIVPHLTVAHTEEAVLDRIDEQIAGGLPIQGTLTEMVLYRYDGTRWQQVSAFPFAAQE